MEASGSVPTINAESGKSTRANLPSAAVAVGPSIAAKNARRAPGPSTGIGVLLPASRPSFDHEEPRAFLAC